MSIARTKILKKMVMDAKGETDENKIPYFITHIWRDKMTVQRVISLIRFDEEKKLVKISYWKKPGVRMTDWVPLNKILFLSEDFKEHAN